MVKSKKINADEDPRCNDNGMIDKDAQMIETILGYFGVNARIAEINFRQRDTEFCLELALGTTIESVIKLHKDIAMALAEPSGDVEIEAPIPGRSLIAIRTYYEKQWYENKLKKYNKAQEEAKKKQEKAESEKYNPEIILRRLIASPFYLVRDIFGKIGDLINSNQKK